MCNVRSGRMCNTVSNNSSITNVPADIYVRKSKIHITSITAGGVPKFQKSPMNIPT